MKRIDPKRLSIDNGELHNSYVCLRSLITYKLFEETGMKGVRVFIR